ncbi:MAG TPA: hypothetical protein V6C88_13215 [Chroococcidiopsis sp.]
MKEQSLQLDPLNSPFPIPWNWVMATQTDTVKPFTSNNIRYYRSPSLLSPDRQYAAYSRIQMQVSADFTQSRVSSVMFVENLKTGDLQTIVAESPFAENPFKSDPDPESGQIGTIAILIPIAWSETGDRILAREFESIFGTDIASDFAVIWDRRLNHIRTIAPAGIAYTNAVLLGWSQVHGDRVLFRTVNLGEEEWHQWAVDSSGQTLLALEDQPITFGQMVTNVWAGPQAHQ